MWIAELPIERVDREEKEGQGWASKNSCNFRTGKGRKIPHKAEARRKVRENTMKSETCMSGKGLSTLPSAVDMMKTERLSLEPGDHWQSW